MIAYTTLLLFFIGTIGYAKVSTKYDKILSFVMLASLCAVFAHFYEDMVTGINHTFSFVWNSSPGGDIKIDIISNLHNYELIFPFFVMTLSAVFFNQLFKYEERRSQYNSVLCFNLAALIVMITSNNFVQLLSAVFIIDILALFLIRNWSAYRRFALMNFAADMMLFTILAMINCKVDSLDLRQILMYKKTGFHINEIALLGLTCVFIKTGFFLFHLSLADLKNVRMHRLQCILFLSAPISALILLLKFHLLWQASPYFIPFLKFECVTTIAFGFWNFCRLDNIKSKLIGLQTAFWALLILLLSFNGFIWDKRINFLLLQNFVVFGCFYLIYFHMNRPNLLSSLSEKKIGNKSSVIAAVCILTASVAAMAGTLTAIYNNSNRYYIWGFGPIFVILSALFCRRILWTLQQKTFSARQSGKFLPSLFLTSLAVVLSKDLMTTDLIAWIFPLVFLLICIIPVKHPLKFSVQDNQTDAVSALYKYILIRPIKLCGRLLWLWVDRMLVEKLILGLIITFARSCLRLFRRAHSNGLIGALIVIIFTCLLLWSSFLNGEIGNV
ncbi:MAG: hypothetical protein IJ852_04955 [Alphaproteobacteria bacterium]|nr:hypothetical protein [Alphaproteobacteria bacterium]